jgi:NAD+--asparagine ADP-ribosyltransferase
VGKRISGTNHGLWIRPIVRTRVKVLTDNWNMIECGIGISKNRGRLARTTTGQE